MISESMHEGTHLHLAGMMQCNDLLRKVHSDYSLKHHLVVIPEVRK